MTFLTIAIPVSILLIAIAAVYLLARPAKRELDRQEKQRRNTQLVERTPKKLASGWGRSGPYGAGRLNYDRERRDKSNRVERDNDDLPSISPRVPVCDDWLREDRHDHSGSYDYSSDSDSGGGGGDD